MKTKPIQNHSGKEYRSPEMETLSVEAPSLLEVSLDSDKPESYIIDGEEIW